MLAAAGAPCQTLHALDQELLREVFNALTVSSFREFQQATLKRILGEASSVLTQALVARRPAK